MCADMTIVIVIVVIVNSRSIDDIRESVELVAVRSEVSSRWLCSGHRMNE
jgi:hypothetical protein